MSIFLAPACTSSGWANLLFQVDLPPGFKICDQNITLERWIIFGLSLVGVLLCMFLLIINSATEMAFGLVSRSFLQEFRDTKAGQRRALTRVLDRSGYLVNLLTTVNVVCYFIAPALAISAVHQFNLYGPEVGVMVALLGVALLVFCRAVPRAMASHNSEKVVRQWSGFINAESWVFSPLVALVGWLSGFFVRRNKKFQAEDNPTDVQEDLNMLVSVAEEESTIPEEEREMMRSIAEFGDTIVREVMVPRLDIQAASLNASLDDLLTLILKSGYSRIPIYKEDIDHIVGILYAKDLLYFMRQRWANPAFQISTFLRQVYYVPESKKVDVLFKELRHSRVHIAVVVDEYGGTAGMVTIEDLLEEIVGEIQDEYDIELPDFEKVNEDEVIIDAKMQLDDVNEFFNTEWQSESVDSIGGYVYNHLKRMPEPGDLLTLDRLGELRSPDELPLPGDVQIKVLKVTGQRLQRLGLTHIINPFGEEGLEKREE